MTVMIRIADMTNLTASGVIEANSLSGASSHLDEGWHTIDWRQVHQNVRRLQARIVKATQEKRWGKVKALQRLLTRSFRGKGNSYTFSGKIVKNNKIVEFNCTN
jgi:hypothetical protein